MKDSLAEQINAIEYEMQYTDPDTGKIVQKKVWEISHDGSIQLTVYEKSGRPEISEAKEKVGRERVEKLCEDLITCMKTAVNIPMLIDDCWGAVAIYFGTDRIVLPRSMENGIISIGRIMESFLDKVSF